MDTFPLAYLLTFICYGTRLHGDIRGSVEPGSNLPGTPYLSHDAQRKNVKLERMDQPPYTMDQKRRRMVMETIKEVCDHRKWLLLAAHVRSNHVHAVVQAAVKPEKIMNDFKAYASRRMNRENIDARDRKRWARHGSTRYLWSPDQVETEVHYVIHEQGEPMEVYVYEG